MKAQTASTTENIQAEALFRFYDPERPLFDKSWALPDIEKI